jgi:hypothetical protein
MRRAILFVAVVLFVLALSTASATTTQIEQHGHETCGSYSGAREWVTEDGVLQVRGGILDCVATGDPYLAGTEVILLNFNLDLATGEGTLWGTWESELSGFEGGFEGTWNGHWGATTNTNGWSGKAVGHGYGDLEGWQARLALRTTTDSVDGFVFSPGA